MENNHKHRQRCHCCYYKLMPQLKTEVLIQCRPVGPTTHVTGGRLSPPVWRVLTWANYTRK